MAFQIVDQGPSGKERTRAAKRAGLAVFAFSARSLQQISTLVITLLAARFLIPTEYGIYTLGIAFLVLIQTMTYTGFYHFVIHSKDDDTAVLSTSFWMITGLSTVAALGLIAAAYPISWLYHTSELATVLILLAAVQPLAGASAWCSAVLLRRRKLTAHFAIMFAQNFIAMVCGAALLWVWQSLFALVAYRYIRVLSGFVLYLVFTRDMPRMIFDRPLARSAAGFSGGLYAARFLTYLSRYSGDLLLGLFYSTAEAGLYRFGSRVASGATDMVAQPLGSFAHSQFGAAGRAEHDLSDLLQRFTGTSVILLGGISAVIIILGPDFLAVFFDPAYLLAVPVIYAIAVRSLLSAGSSLVEPAFSAAGKTWIVTRFLLWNTSLMVLAVLVSAQFGLAVMAWSQTLVTGLNIIIAMSLLRRFAGVDIGPAIRAFLIGCALIALYGAVLHATWWHLGDLMTLHPGTEVFAGLIWAMVLAVPTLLIGARLRIFSLSVFSG